MKTFLMCRPILRITNEPVYCGLLLPAVAVFYLLLIPATLQAQEFGDLFTSPDEREYLDYLRQDFVNRSQLATFNIEEDVIPDIPVVEEVIQETVNTTTVYRFGGIMMRTNGNRLIWLNGKQVLERELPADISLLETASGTLLNIRSNGMNYQLKPGQSATIKSDNISDSPVSATDLDEGLISATSENTTNTTTATLADVMTALSTGMTGSSAIASENQAADVLPEGDQAPLPDTFEGFLEAINIDRNNLEPTTLNELERAYQQAREK